MMLIAYRFTQLDTPNHKKQWKMTKKAGFQQQYLKAGAQFYKNVCNFDLLAYLYWWQGYHVSRYQIRIHYTVTLY